VPEIFDFGKHTVHVWGSFGLTLFVMVANIVAAKRALSERSQTARRRLASSAANPGTQR